MSNIDRELLNARKLERESTVREGLSAEKIVSEGRTLETMQEDARVVLGISPDDIIELEYEKVLARQNDEANAFSILNTFIDKSTKYNIATEEETKVLNAIQSRMAEQVCARFNIDLEDLFEEA